MLFSYTTKVVMLGNLASSLEIGDLPIVPANMRATFNFLRMKSAMRTIKLRVGNWKPKPGSGWELGYRLSRVNAVALTAQLILAAISAVLFYSPAFFLQKLVEYLEADPLREDRGWGWAYVSGLFFANAVSYLGIAISLPFLIYALLSISHSYRAVMVSLDDFHPSSLARPNEFHSICQNPDPEGCGFFCRVTQRQRGSGGACQWRACTGKRRKR
jgi:hypothetical protein